MCVLAFLHAKAFVIDALRSYELEIGSPTAGKHVSPRANHLADAPERISLYLQADKAEIVT